EDEIGRKLMNELAYEAFPSIPVAGDSFHYLGTKISVLVMRHNRIMRLKVRRLTEEELTADRDAEEMAAIDPETGRFLHGEHPYDIQQAQGRHYARDMQSETGRNQVRKPSDPDSRSRGQGERERGSRAEGGEGR
ncbi:MAG: hypothetical protein IIZ22_05415, partial [Clostridia bacterium]|nr:hypothetical protein [Clostridia bacterium]